MEGNSPCIQMGGRLRFLSFPNFPPTRSWWPLVHFLPLRPRFHFGLHGSTRHSLAPHLTERPRFSTHFHLRWLCLGPRSTNCLHHHRKEAMCLVQTPAFPQPLTGQS